MLEQDLIPCPLQNCLGKYESAFAGSPRTELEFSHDSLGQASNGRSPPHTMFIVPSVHLAARVYRRRDYDVAEFTPQVQVR